MSRSVPPQDGEEVLLEKQGEKDRGEMNKNKETIIKTADFKFESHLVYLLPEVEIPTPLFHL